VAEIRSIQKLMHLVLLLLPLLLQIPAIRSVLGVFANFGLFIVVFGLPWLQQQHHHLMKNNSAVGAIAICSA